MIFYTKWKAKRDKAYYDSLPETGKKLWDMGVRFDSFVDDPMAYGSGFSAKSSRIIAERALASLEGLRNDNTD